MATGQRTGKQKALFVISVIFIIFGAIGFGGCVLLAAGVGVVSTLAAASGSADAGTALFAGSIGVVLLVFSSIGCIIDIIIGVLGIRGANNAAKVGAFNVFAIIGLIFAIISLALTIGAICTNSSAASSASSAIISAIISLILPGICVWLGTSIKKEGNPTQF